MTNLSPLRSYLADWRTVYDIAAFLGIKHRRNVYGKLARLERQGVRLTARGKYPRMVEYRVQ